MKIIQGDLLQLAKQGDFDVIIQGCNCFCTMGAGIAKSIKNASTFDREVIVEEKINGREFSIIIVQDLNNNILPFFPTEIKLDTRNNQGHSGNFYSRIKKYLPAATRQADTRFLQLK